MNIDPTELSVAQQAALRHMTKAIIKQIDTVFIFCFALQRHESLHTHCFTQRTSKRWFKADILLVYSDDEERSLHDIQHLANNLGDAEHQYTAVVVSHTTAMQHLASGDAFVCTIFRHGALLYSQKTALPGRQGFVCHETLLQKTREGWRRWFTNSCQFMDCAVYCIVEGNFGMALFMVHQTVEQACKAILKVMLYMRPCTHNLAWMLKLCGGVEPAIDRVFPKDNPQDKALFNLLKDSYNDSRYAAGFEVKEEEAWALYYRASTLLRIAGELCNRRIGEMEALTGTHPQQMENAASRITYRAT
ncbi:HEPN domain-containing protein [Parapedobacter sp. DT-150]|uniref:HEPN domain-containing protein n=1 Tax=Parapedobacter sp. DT-150 TaxID=3396162 RepID=UPI003F19C984